MSKDRIRKGALGTMLGVAAMFGAVAPAEAIVYRGTWDPPYGAPFPDLGWRGFADFLVPDACIGLVGTFSNNPALPPSCGGGTMAVLAAEVTFYNSTTDPAGLIPLQTLVFSPPVVVYSMTLNVTPTGVTTGYMAPVQGNIPIAQYAGNDMYFHLAFVGSQAELAYTNSPFDSPSCRVPVVGVCGFNEILPDAEPILKFSPAIPEPESYALMLLGLAAVGAATRRRRR